MILSFQVSGLFSGAKLLLVVGRVPRWSPIRGQGHFVFTPSQIHAFNSCLGGMILSKKKPLSVLLLVDFGFVFFLVHLPTVQNDKMWSTFPQGLAGICGWFLNWRWNVSNYETNKFTYPSWKPQFFVLLVPVLGMCTPWSYTLWQLGMWALKVLGYMHISSSPKNEEVLARQDSVPRDWKIILQSMVFPCGIPAWTVVNQQLGGGFKDFYFYPCLGKWTYLTNISQMGVKPPTRQPMSSVFIAINKGISWTRIRCDTPSETHSKFFPWE